MLIVIEFFIVIVILKPLQIYQPKQCVVVSLKFLNSYEFFIEHYSMSSWLYWELFHAVLQAFDMVNLMKWSEKLKQLSCEKLFQDINGIK